MPLNPEDHPWVQAAEHFRPQPMQAAAQWQPIQFELDGETKKMALLTTVTSAGVNSIFVNPEQIEALCAQGNDILKMWKSEESTLVIARPEDMKREVRAQSLINPAIKNGHKF